MDTLQKAIALLKEAKITKQLGVFKHLEETETLKFIAQQAQDIDHNGNKFKALTNFKGATNKIAYNSAINQFGEPLVNAAIELYNS